MSDRFPVEVSFFGEPFDREAVIHTLRHLAMRIGWTIRLQAAHRLVYATTDDPKEIPAREGDLVVLSSQAVRNHIAEGLSPVPLKGNGKDARPFFHARAGAAPPEWIHADVIAGAHALLNLHYERKNIPEGRDGWIRFTEDWWSKAGFAQPEALADVWLDTIASQAEKIGWPVAERPVGAGLDLSRGTVLLTHDVDYMPSNSNRGFSRFLRAVLRQALTRRSIGQAWQTADKYRSAFFQPQPYNALAAIADGEAGQGAVSSFQFTVRRRHRSDPAYELAELSRRDGTLMNLIATGFEVCLHGSYRAARTPGGIKQEKAELEAILGTAVSGHRQHYLNFHPGAFFSELEKAGLEYDMSVGYNDMSGPRAGTLFPYRPYDMEKGRPISLWEIPFIVMDTTLATTCRFSYAEAFNHSLDQLRVIEKGGGCVSLIWHQEQMSGLLDPGFDGIYWSLLKNLKERGIRMTSGQRIMSALNDLWKKTVEE